MIPELKRVSYAHTFNSPEKLQEIYEHAGMHVQKAVEEYLRKMKECMRGEPNEEKW